MKKKQSSTRTPDVSRRQFVKQSALVGGSLMLSGVFPGRMLAHPSSTTGSGIRETSFLSEGWRINSMEPGSSLSTAQLAELSKQAANSGWLEVPSVPAMPHKILLHHQKIEEPWKPHGMEKCYWVSQKDWIYALKFQVRDQAGEQRLLFKELKGDVSVYLNGELLARQADQAHPLAVDVSGKLDPENQLLLHFKKAAPDLRPGQADPSVRKKNGTYLGPNPMLYTSGIVGEVFLERTDGHLLEEIITDFSLNETFTQGRVSFKLSGKSTLNKAKIRVRLLDPKGEEVAASTLSTAVNRGIFFAEPSLEVTNPDLWWPRAYGDQSLYKAEISLLVSGKVHQQEERTIGFRKITMPEDYHFQVNGRPVFLRGGDWVTPDLLSEVWDQQRMEGLFDLAEHANFNAFRIWGQVEAPNDRFYEMADERGFLLWQDFTKMPFRAAEGNIPEVQDKARKFLIRLKHHPSILLWCGINEAAMWWHEDYNREFTDKGPWPGITGSDAVEQVCKELDPDRHYTPSAPYGGVNANEPREGTTNGYTNMWYVPGYDYLNFASEDTRISCPTLQSMEKFMLPEEICPEGYTTLALHGNMNPYPDTWRMFTAAESWKKTGPVEQFYDATDAASLANRIGMAEGVYYRDVVERQRRGRPGDEDSDRRCCGGYLVWKYNDSWVSIYSAKVDYFLEPYHVYYTLRAAYAPVILSFDIGTYIYLWAINDSTKPVSGRVKIQLYHLQANEFRKEIVREVTLEPGKSKVVVRLDEAGIRAFRKEHVLFAQWTASDGKVLASSNALADIERRCIFPDARLDVSVEGNSLHITTDKFARNINLVGNADGEKLGWLFEDNYFDLFPGEKKVVQVLGHHQKGVISAKPWYSPHETKVDYENNTDT
jgi:hypothetical protein